MSFSAGVTARSKTRAEALLEQHAGIPDSVRAFVNESIDRVSMVDEVLISVSAYGHMASDHEYDTQSSTTIEVKALKITD